MGNTFLNGVETSQEEAACLLLGIPITQMSREVSSLIQCLLMKEHSY